MKTITGMGGTGGARELAEMLRQMGRGPDTMLAHITPEEAEMLMRMGGSGQMNPNTGLPEFQPDYGELLASESDYRPMQFPDIDYRAQILASEDPGYYGTSQTGYNEALERNRDGLPMSERNMYDVRSRGLPTSLEYTGQRQDVADFIAPYTQAGMDASDIGFGPGQFMPPARRADLGGMPQDQVERLMGGPEPSRFARTAEAVEGGIQNVRDTLSRYPNIREALSLTGQTLPGLLMARKAQREGRAAAEELRALGRPLREQGEALRQQALSGGLTPQQARQQEASRARLLQQAAGRGAATGTQQAMIENTLARERAGLAEVNLNQAIKQLNLANAYDEAAIRAKLVSDRQVAESLSNIYGNLSRRMAGQSTQQTQAPAPRAQEAVEPPVTRRPDVRG